MSRPRINEPRQHQVNVRVSTHELVRIHRHASLLGKTITEFGRSVMLRRPRRKRNPPLEEIAFDPGALARLEALGYAVNEVARRFHATGEIDRRALAVLLTRLRLFLRRSLAGHFAAQAQLKGYALAPATRTQLRKLCTNLVQIADRFRHVGLSPPVPLSNLIGRLRSVLNNDGNAHGA
jgi:hypothetical protein